MVCHVTVTAAVEGDTWEAAALRAALEAAGLTQTKLAQLTGMDRSVVNALANGRRAMTRESAERLAAHLPVTPEELLPPPAGEDAHTEDSPLVLLRRLAVAVETQQRTLDDLQSRVETLERAAKTPRRAPRAAR